MTVLATSGSTAATPGTGAGTARAAHAHHADAARRPDAARRLDPARHPDAAHHPDPARDPDAVHHLGRPEPADPWITATVCPAGSFGRADAGRLRALLDALSACASIVVLDLRSARLRSRRAAEAVDEAAVLLEARGGCLLCLHADDETRARLADAGPHAVVLPDDADGAEPAAPRWR